MGKGQSHKEYYGGDWSLQAAEMQLIQNRLGSAHDFVRLRLSQTGVQFWTLNFYYMDQMR